MFRSRTEGHLTTTVGIPPKWVAPTVLVAGLITILTLRAGILGLLVTPLPAICEIVVGLAMLYGMVQVFRVLFRQAGRDLRALFS